MLQHHELPNRVRWGYLTLEEWAVEAQAEIERLKMKLRDFEDVAATSVLTDTYRGYSR